MANFVVIYGIGLHGLFGLLTPVQGSMPTMAELSTMGLVPFAPDDIVKLLGGLAIGKAIIPNESFGNARLID